MVCLLELSSKDESNFDFIFTITDYKKKARVPIGRIKINYKNNPVIPIATMYCEKENLFYEKQKLFHAVINELNKNLKNIDKKVKILGNAISLNCSSANKSWVQ